jgi:hypothetical protein
MRVLMLEFNELSPSLMDRFIAQGHLPAFKQLRDTSCALVTDAEEVSPNLEPWIQWVTVHTGLRFSDHRCFSLNDGPDLKADRIWDVLGAAGGPSWVCGSMNTGFDPAKFHGHFLPDPWATDTTDYPPRSFSAFANVVRAFVQEHSGKPDVSPAAMARFGAFMVANGLSLDTVTTTMKQLVDERLRMTKWRRALILDRLQWDLFRAVYQREKPQLATFFLNSTAHFQHFHWREMEPDLFKIKPSDADLEIYGDTILDGYRGMDRIVAQALALADGDTCVVLCTALSQQPMLAFEDGSGRQIFRHRDIRHLLAFAGVTDDCEYAPVMSQEFLLHCQNDETAARVAGQLESLVMADGRQVMWATPKGAKIDAGCKVYTDPGAMLVMAPAVERSLPFPDLFYPLESLRSGMHSPYGIFWVKAPGRAAPHIEQPVPLTRVYPTLVDLLGLPPQPGRDASIFAS